MESNTKKPKNSVKTGKGNPPKEKEFQAGQSGNPNGRPKKYITQITEATGYKISQVQDCIKSMLKLNLVELKRVGESSTAPALEVLIARGINGDLKRGELRNLESLLSRSFGKPTEQIEHSGEVGVYFGAEEKDL